MTALPSSNCIDPQQLERYAAGQLSGREAERCEVHLENCHTCAAALADYFESGRAAETPLHEFAPSVMESATTDGAGLGFWRRMHRRGVVRDNVCVRPAADANDFRSHRTPASHSDEGDSGVPAAIDEGYAREDSTSKITKLDHRSNNSTPPVESHGSGRCSPVPVASDAPLTLVGRYRLDHLIGTGGSGCVYMAFDERLKRRVAVKLPHPGIIESPERIELLLAEAQTVASLDHPGIAPIYDVGNAGGQRLFLVTKLIDGVNLAERLKRGAVLDMDAVRWTTAIADALQYAHDQAVIHRDIKPENILLDEAGHVFVTDFGLAWRLNEAELKYPRAGTPAYMSPEQFQSIDASIDHRTDIYSLGRILLEILGPSAPSALLRIGQRATETQPAARYQSAAEMAAELRGYAEAIGWTSVSIDASGPGPAQLPSGLEPSAGSIVAHTLSHDSNPIDAAQLKTRQRLTSAVKLAASILLVAALATAWSYWSITQRRALAMDELLRAIPASLPECITAARECGPSLLPELKSLATSDNPRWQLRAKATLMATEPRYVTEVMKAMISADADLAAALSSLLVPHTAAIADDIWQVAMDPNAKSSARLNATMFLAIACSDDHRWSDVEFQSQVAECLVHDDMHSLGIRATAFNKVRTQIILGIRHLSVTGRMLGLERLLIYDVWNSLVRDDIPGTIDLLVECPPVMFEKVVERLQADALTIENLRAKLRDLKPTPMSGAFSRHFLSALALLKLGRVDDFLELWIHAPELERPEMILTNVGYPPITKPLLYSVIRDGQMLRLLANSPVDWSERLYDTYLSQRRSLLRGVTRPNSTTMLPEEDVRELIEQLKVLATREPDSGMRSVAEFAFHEMGRSNLVDTLQYQPPLPDRQGRAGWSINSLGQVMVHVYDAPSVEHAFAIGQYEVDCGLYEQFLCETGYAWSKPSNSLTPKEDRASYPQSHVSWYDCAAFCNWLSRREGLEECYACNADGYFAEGMSLKTNFVELSGYRLPLSTEWRDACGAGATTKFTCGNNGNLMRRYAWMEPESSGKPARTGRSAPNALGLFDVHGNLREWTLDSVKSDRFFWCIRDCQPREHRGGDFQSSSFDQLELDHIKSDGPQTRRATVGFRIVRSLMTP